MTHTAVILAQTSGLDAVALAVDIGILKALFHKLTLDVIFAFDGPIPSIFHDARKNEVLLPLSHKARLGLRAEGRNCCLMKSLYRITHFS